MGLYNVGGNINIPKSVTKITSLQDIFGNTGASVGGFVLTFSDNPPYDTFKTLDFDYVTQNYKIKLKGEFRIPEGIKYLGIDTQNGFMRGYPAITSVAFPSTIETIYSQSFMDCSNITQVSFPSSLSSGNSGISVGDRAFLNTNIRVLVLPDTITKIGSTAFGNTIGSSPKNPLKTVYLNVNDNIHVAGLNGQSGSLPFSGLQFNSAVIICKNEISYNSWRLRSFVNPQVIYDSLTYELDLKFCDPTTGEPIATIDSQRKLYNKTIQYEKDYGGEALLWDKDLSYQLPDIPSQYKGATGWSSTPGGQAIKDDEIVLWDKLYPTPIKNEILVTPKEMVSYTGGTSLSGNDFPNILFDAIDSDNNKFEINNYTVIFDDEADNKSLLEYLDSIYGFYLIAEDGTVAVESSHESDSEAGKKYAIKPLSTDIVDINVRNVEGEESIISVVYVDQGNTPSILTVRPTLSKGENSVIQSNTTLPSTPVNQPTVQLHNNAQYTDSAGTILTDLANITLISSSFLDTDNESTVINSAINTNLSGYTISKVRLALADNSNGNIYTTVSEGNVSLIFPYPDSSSKEDDFVILHFSESSDLTNPFDYTNGDIYKSTEGRISKTDAGLKIEIDNFSPFVVGYKHKSDSVLQTPVFITEAPNTGDSTSLILIFGFCLISLLGIVIAWVKMKKNKES